MKNFNINIKFGKMSMGCRQAGGGILRPGTVQGRIAEFQVSPASLQKNMFE